MSDEAVDGSAVEARAEELAPVVAERLGVVRQRIEAAGGEPERIRIVAVTKTWGPEAVLAALRAGISHIGENYADELVQKASALAQLEHEPAGGTSAGASGGAISWHFIGAVQRRKVASLSPLVSWWETVSRSVEAEEIGKRSSGRPAVLIEVNVSGDPSRPGCSRSDLPRLVDEVRQTGLDLRGLMAVAPLGATPGETERTFSDLAEAARSLGLEELSMGMSQDLEQAVRAGTTMVRIGSALFGPRNPRTAR